jgi:hypothetical protein
VTQFTAFHGSHKAFAQPTEFHASKAMDFGPGFYLSTDERDAVAYGQRIYQADVALENPIVISVEGADPALVTWFKRNLRLSDADLGFYANPIAAAFTYANTLIEVGSLSSLMLMSALMKRGYDGIFVERAAAKAHNKVNWHGDIVVLWSPAQILSWRPFSFEEGQAAYRRSGRD